MTQLGHVTPQNMCLNIISVKTAQKTKWGKPVVTIYPHTSPEEACRMPKCILVSIEKRMRAMTHVYHMSNTCTLNTLSKSVI